jgi:hypothetical protein
MTLCISMLVVIIGHVDKIYSIYCRLCGACYYYADDAFLIIPIRHWVYSSSWLGCVRMCRRVRHCRSGLHRIGIHELFVSFLGRVLFSFFWMDCAIQAHKILMNAWFAAALTAAPVMKHIIILVSVIMFAVWGTMLFFSLISAFGLFCMLRSLSRSLS